MESRCIPATERATLVFEIIGYSLHKGMGTGKFIQSAPASVGGYQWCIRYYPDGDGSEEEVKDHVSVFLELLDKGPEVRALYDFQVGQPGHRAVVIAALLLGFPKGVQYMLLGDDRQLELEQSASWRGAS